MLLEVPVAREDVVIDLGAGLGKVALLVRLLTGGTVRGVEIQRELVERAREGAERHGVALTCGDVRQVPLDDGTIFFLYLPFTGPVLTEVLDRLREVATRHAIVVCTLGVDLERMAPWLVPRPIDSFWLAIYDGVVPGVPPRPSHARSSVLGRDAEAIAFERPAT
jgi:SAM-dependent methyltransferase